MLKSCVSFKQLFGNHTFFTVAFYCNRTPQVRFDIYELILTNEQYMSLQLCLAQDSFVFLYCDIYRPVIKFDNID